MTFQNYNVYDGLTSVKLISTNNIVGNYNNGPVNNGVEATLKTSSGILIIDLVTVQIGDSVLLSGQTNANENGIYVVIQTGTDFISTVLQRRKDFQCIEQIRSGQYITSSDGSVNSGSMYVVVDPLPNILGVDDIILSIVSTTGLRELTINESDLTGLKNYSVNANYAIFNGLNLHFESPLNTPFSLDPQIVGTMDISSLSGIVQGSFINSGSTINLSGSYTGLASVVANNVTINMENATINGSFIVGNLTTINPIGTPTNISSITPHLTLNSTGLTLNTFTLINGDFNYFFDLNNAVSYFSTAGTASGSAGDTTHCNANSVLKIKVNGVDKYLPLFDSNA